MRYGAGNEGSNRRTEKKWDRQVKTQKIRRK